MAKEQRTENVNFRVSVRAKRWLDILVEDSPFNSISDYLNNEVFQRTKDLIVEKAYSMSRLTAGEKFGFPLKMSLGIEVPEDVIGLFDKEKTAEFRQYWVAEYLKEGQKLRIEFGIDGYEVTEKTFDDHAAKLKQSPPGTYSYNANINLTSRAIHENQGFIIKPKKEDKNA